jgi:hypothetical protein
MISPLTVLTKHILSGRKWAGRKRLPPRQFTQLPRKRPALTEFVRGNNIMFEKFDHFRGNRPSLFSSLFAKGLVDRIGNILHIKGSHRYVLGIF